MLNFRKMENGINQIYKMKEKIGSIDWVHDKQTIIGKDLFKKETDMNQMMKVLKENGSVLFCFPTYSFVNWFPGEIGVIESLFGKTGKFKVRF